MLFSLTQSCCLGLTKFLLGVILHSLACYSFVVYHIAPSGWTNDCFLGLGQSCCILKLYGSGNTTKWPPMAYDNAAAYLTLFDLYRLHSLTHRQTVKVICTTSISLGVSRCTHSQYCRPMAAHASGLYNAREQCSESDYMLYLMVALAPLQEYLPLPVAWIAGTSVARSAKAQSGSISATSLCPQKNS